MGIVLKYFAYILIISGFFRIIPIITAVVHKEPVFLFIVSFLLSLILGVMILLFNKKNNKKKKNKEESSLTLRKGLMIVALSFVFLPLIGMISFLPSFDYNIINSYFESVSGFTTTGLTLYESVDALPTSLLLWRAETQWIGGIGIVMVFLFIFSMMNFPPYKNRITETEENVKTAVSLYLAQGFKQSTEPGLKTTPKNVFFIYLLYTAIGVTGLMIFGMPFIDSLGMSFTSISTGGFVMSDSFYSNNGQLVVLSIMMLLGAMSFITHNKLLKGRIKNFIFSYEKNVFLLFLAIAIGLIYIVYKNFGVVVFQAISAFTTTGYSIAPVALLPPLFIFMIVIGMIFGGNLGSTAGGIKTFRIHTLLNSIPWLVKKTSSPKKAVIPFKIKNKSMEENDLLIITIFFATYMFALLIGTIIFMILGNGFLDSSFQVVSALGTVGLQTMQLAGVHWIGKFVLIFAMLFGRLEIFPLLMLIRRIFKG